jgi:hypothetical protein
MAGFLLCRPSLPSAGAVSLALAWTFASGCTVLPKAGAPGEPALNAVSQQAARQIKRCYRAPRVASSGKQISTRLRVRYRPDGGLADVPQLVWQGGVTPANEAYAADMAKAAGLAVMRCAPVSLPPELYREGWSVLEFTFSPNARV